MLKLRVIILIVFISAYSVHLFSQGTFKQDYYASSRFYGLLELQNSDYLFMPNMFCRLNQSGGLIYQHSYEAIGSFFLMNRVEKLDNQNFIMTGYIVDSCPNQFTNHFLICKGGTQGTFIKQSFFKLTNCKSLTPLWSELNEDKSLVCGGRNQHAINPVLFFYDGPFYLMKVHPSLDSVAWIKQYTNHWGAPSFCKQLPDKSFIVGLNLDTAGACLAKLDSMGNVIWCKSFFRPKGMITNAVVDTDGNIMCVGFTDTIVWSNGPYPNWFTTQLFLMKFDTAGNVIWCKGFDDVHPFHWSMKSPPIIKPTLDGNFIIGSTKLPNLITHPGWHENAYIIKVDYNGDTLFTRGYGFENRVTWLSNLLPVSDGGYLLTGDFYGAISWPFGGCYVYKTDSLGFTSCGNVQEPVSITTLFPTDSNVVLLSIDDSVTVLNANITDTIYPFPPTADDCIAVGFPLPPTSSGYNIFPNPTKGEFTIEIPSPLKRDSFITVYNSMGKIVLQKPIATEKDLQLDLSKYGKGIYLVKVREGDKESSSKVVVE